MKASSLTTILLLTLIGIAVGIGLFTFVYARGGSYLTNDPAACANCHIMETHYESWMKSSHRAVAACNDCHTPPGAVAKYAVKASNGFWHSFAFTTGDFHYPIQIKESNREVTEQACRHCHAQIVASMAAGPHIVGAGETAIHADAADEEISCIRCHNTVGHWVR